MRFTSLLSRSLSGVDRPDAAVNIVDNFRQVLTILQDAGFLFCSEVMYDVCCKCYNVYRGPDEVAEPATHCQACGHVQEKCLNFLYR
jgi:hypothetical protein